MTNKPGLYIPLASFQVQDVSDGYHSFRDLYAHRNALFMALMLAYPKKAYISKQHSDGSSFDGYFLAGIETPYGHITYHLPMDEWLNLEGKVTVHDYAPFWDGHKPANVVDRLRSMVIIGIPEEEEAEQ